MFTVRVPASTANLGPGFDCMGIALQLYNTASFEQTDRDFEITITDESSAYVPSDENNLVYRAMNTLFVNSGKKLEGIKVTVSSQIPVTRGLGSSSAGIVLGLVGGNHLLGDKFSNDELLKIACDIEGHPDNVTAALLGGFTIAYAEKEKILHMRSPISENLRFAAMIPDFYFQTKKSRSVLPKYVPMRSAIYNIAHASILSSALTTGDVSLLSSCFRDRIHQKYRFPYIKSGEYITRASRRFGAYGAYISGAGPTIMSVVDKDNKDYEYNMNELIKTNLKDWHLVMLDADNRGACIE